MALQFFDKRVIGAYIVDAWQNHFNTEMDPADGQWFTNGPNNNGGLYGRLTDTLATELVFDESKQIFTPHQIAAATAIADNRDGLTPEQTVTLTYSYSDATSSTHSTTNGLKVGVGVDIKAKATFLGAGGEVTTKISTEYTYSWTDATTVSKSETKTFQQSIPVRNIPKGKVYQVVLLCNKNELRIPYHADIYLSGQSSACFASPVNGQKIWAVDAGTLCEWINQFGSAGDESYKYGRDPNNPLQGVVALLGNMTATQTANFTARTSDITDSFTGSEEAPAVSRVVGDGGTPVSPGAVVNEMPLSK
jgi:Clostridium epsilon toxin ETX/Bacillus mosquitocidal toxin MTX2